ncbi:MAG: CHAT domain-containing protein [Microcystaceae cyanobacterium]
MELTNATRQLVEYFDPPQPPLKRGESSIVSPVSQFDPNPSQPPLKRGEYATGLPSYQGVSKGRSQHSFPPSQEEIKRRLKLIQFLQNPSSYPRIDSPYTVSQSPVYNLIHQPNHPLNKRGEESTTEKAPLKKGGLGGSNPILNEEEGGSNLQDWIEQWDTDYQEYRSKKTQSGDNKKDHSWRTNISDRLQTLKQLLDIPTLETDLTDVKELIFVPHRDLHRFPLHSLFTAKDWTISYTPSLQIAINLKDNSVKGANLAPLKDGVHDVQLEWRLLSIENPVNDLPFAEIESTIVNTYFPNITPSITTIEDFKNAIPNPTHVHYTGHGYYNFTHPERSALSFANHTPLTAYEISHLNFTSYQLITLAACETALSGNQLIESEYVGLVSAFLKSGVNCVISTLWTVSSINHRSYRLWNLFSRTIKCDRKRRNHPY